MSRRHVRATLLINLLLALRGFAADRRGADADAVRLHQRKAVTLLERYAPSPLRDQQVQRELERASARLERAFAAKPAPPRPGLSEEAYVCAIDGSAQPYHRFLPSAWTPGADGMPPALPLIVYLHGYWPTLDLINWAVFPTGLTNLAEQTGACVAIPFGRGNTDFQGIGEQDVLTVIDLMRHRYGTDPDRTILLGYSMGGMGAYTLGARFAERFNGLLIVCGRGDYDVWHGLAAAALPPWERALVDAHFLSGRAPRLAGMPILAYHGAHDPLVRLAEAEAAFHWIRPHTADATLIVLPEGDHWIIEEVLERPDCRAWLERVLAKARTPRPAPLGIRPGEVPSRLQNAFLDPFFFVQATPPTPENDAAFARRCAEWTAFANAHPRRRRQEELDPGILSAFNLFLFGEPEDSALIRAALRRGGVRWSATEWLFAERSVPRAGHGLWLAAPAVDGRTHVVQCGLPWGAALPPNHRYDMLPDLLVYGPEPGRLGINVARGAARVTDDGRLEWW